MDRKERNSHQETRGRSTPAWGSTHPVQDGATVDAADTDRRSTVGGRRREDTDVGCAEETSTATMKDAAAEQMAVAIHEEKPG